MVGSIIYRHCPLIKSVCQQSW